MADEKVVVESEKKEATSAVANTVGDEGKKKKKGKWIISRIWNGIFRSHGDDFEKRLQYITKEEATVMARLSRRSRSWRRTSRQLIIFSVIFERYDTDPAAKAAAATVLASKLGADSGLKVYVGNESMSGAPIGKSNDAEPVKSGLRNRKQVQSRSTSTGTATPNHSEKQQLVGSAGIDQTHTSAPNQPVVVEHHQPQSSTLHDGWIARIAALLVGEDPTQSYAIICGNCHMHNGLARMEDFPFITYYCPHCHALNKPKQSGEQVSSINSPIMGSPKANGNAAVENVTASIDESIIKSNNLLNKSNEIEEVSEIASSGDKNS